MADYDKINDSAIAKERVKKRGSQGWRILADFARYQIFSSVRFPREGFFIKRI